MRYHLEHIPFSSLYLLHTLGFYDNDDKACFITRKFEDITIDEKIIELLFFDRELGLKLVSAIDFSIAPSIAASIGEKISFVLNKSESNEKDKNIEERAQKVNAPFLSLFPVVLECRITDYKEETLSSEKYWYTIIKAEILNYNISEAAIDDNGEVDYLKFLRKAEWVSFINPKEATE